MLYALGGSETLVKRICFIMIHDLVMRCTKIFAGTQKKNWMHKTCTGTKEIT